MDVILRTKGRTYGHPVICNIILGCANHQQHPFDSYNVIMFVQTSIWCCLLDTYFLQYFTSPWSNLGIDIASLTLQPDIADAEAVRFEVEDADLL